MRVEASNKPDNPYRLAFIGQPEIEVVRTAYIEHNYRLEMDGNPSSITPFDRAIASWSRHPKLKGRAIITPKPTLVVDKLRDLYENTAMVAEGMAEFISEVADPDLFDIRLAGVTWRYNIGGRALALAQETELRLSEYVVDDKADVDFDLVFAPILLPRQSDD